MEFGPIIVPLLIVVSGVIAYVGNLVGRYIGRERLTLFGLRPRHTAQLVTILSGMLITLITLASVLVVSRTARTALFQVRALEAETRRLEQEIRVARSRLAELKRGDIAYLLNQEVLRDVIDARQPLDAIVLRVDDLRLRAVNAALASGIGVDGTTGSVLILFPARLTWDQVAEMVQGHKGETILRIVANGNTLKGEPLEVYVQLIDNALAFRRGAVVASGTVNGAAARSEIGSRLLTLVDEASERARGKVLSPPAARTTTPPVLQVDIDVVRAAAREVAGAGRSVRVDVVALRDAYTLGPLVIGFRPHL